MRRRRERGQATDTEDKENVPSKHFLRRDVADPSKRRRRDLPSSAAEFHPAVACYRSDPARFPPPQLDRFLAGVPPPPPATYRPGGRWQAGRAGDATSTSPSPTATDRSRAVRRPRQVRLVALCSFHASFGQTYNIPPPSERLPNCVCSKSSFSAGTTNYKYITETFFQRTINAGNYSSLSNQSKGCKFMPEMYPKIRLSVGLGPPGPAGGAYALTQAP